MNAIPQFLLALLPSTIAWNPEGHRIIGLLAETLLSDLSKTYVESHLRFETLGDAGVYADSIAWSNELHFAHTSPYRDCGSIEFVIDELHCPNGRCIVTAIANYTDRASDPELKESERSEALKFLVHFYGDIHQPLHLGFREDHGAVDIILKNHEGMSLHQLWDSVLIARAMKTTKRVNAIKGKKGSAVSLEEEFAKLLAYEYAGLSRTEKDAIEEVTPLGMAAETSQLATCEAAYKDEFGVWIPKTGYKVSEQYKGSRTDTVRRQLIRASARLAKAINEIAQEYYEKQRERRAIEVDRAHGKPAAQPYSCQDSGSAESLALPSNRYASLTLEFDIDDLVFLEEESASSQFDKLSVVVPGEVERKTSSSSVNRRRNVKITKESDDFSSVVLIKRGPLYFMTSVFLAGQSRAYMPARSLPFWMLVKRRIRDQSWNSADEDQNTVERYEHMLVSFDSLVFGDGPLDVKLVTRAMTEVGQRILGKRAGREIHLNAASSSVVGSHSLVPDIRQLTQAASEVVDTGESSEIDESNQVIPSADGDMRSAASCEELVSSTTSSSADRNRKKKERKKHNKEIETFHAEQVAKFTKNLSQICLFQIDGLRLLITVDALKDSSYETFRLNMHKVLVQEDGRVGIILIDRNLFDSRIDAQVGKLLENMGLETTRLTRRHWSTRPALKQELSSLYMYLFHPDAAEREIRAKQYFEFLNVSPSPQGGKSYTRLDVKVSKKMGPPILYPHLRPLC